MTVGEGQPLALIGVVAAKLMLEITRCIYLPSIVVSAGGRNV